jgi:hypothetical protein
VSDLYVPATRLRRPSWRDSRLLIGVVIVLASVAIGARVVAAADDSIPVYAAAGTLASGHPIGAGDVRVVRVRLGAGTATYLSARLQLPPGLVVTRALGEGELVPRSAVAAAGDLTRRPVPIPIAAPLPEALRPGVAVDVWSSAKDTATGSTGYRAPVRIAEHAEVYAVTAPGAGLAAAQASAVQVLLEEAELRAVLDGLANGAKLAVVPAPGTSPDPAPEPASGSRPVGPAGSVG